MKLRILLPLAFLFSAQLAPALDHSRISQVTLYPGSATVERIVRVAAGAKQVEIGGLPASFDMRTIRIEADASIRLGEFIVRDVASTEAVNSRQAELEAKIQALGDQIAQLDVERQSAELVTSYLKGLGQPVEGSKPAPIESRALTATLETIRNGGHDAYGRMHKVALQKRELEKQQAALQRELEKITEQNRDSRSIRLNLAADRVGDLRISYQLNGPGWQPVYRATLDTASGNVQIERQAQIAQASGEDWQNVALKLSTGQPRSAPQGRAPRPWQLSLYEPRPVMAERSAKLMAMPAAPMQAPLMAKLARRDEETLFDVTELQGAFATEFEVPASVSLPGDGRKVTVSLSRQSIPMKLRVQVVPRQDVTAFLIATGEQPQGVWLPGDIQLYRDSTYIGSSQWNTQEGNKLELPFGRDDLVRVSINHTKTMNSSSGFLDQRRERQIAAEYTVSNQHRQAIDLMLLEPAPVSTHEQIKVEARFEPKPGKENWEDKQGVVAWEQTIPASSSRKFSVSYQITWPKDAEIIGLPR